MELYESIQDQSPETSYMLRYVDSRPFTPGPNDSTQIERLNTLRNSLIHFAPASWLIDPAYAIESLLGSQAVLRFLVEDCPLITWHPNELKDRAIGFLRDVEQSLGRLSAQYAVASR
jgi:hypothetical protein